MKLKHNNTAVKPFFRASVRNAADGGAAVLELMVYEQIGEDFWTGGGITAKNFKQQIDQAGAFSRIAMRINSPGGDAFEGVAILNLLRSLGKPVDVHVDGIAASAASIIAMAGDTISMGSGAMIMIHNAWTFAMGNAVELTKQASTLSAIDGSIAQAYVDRTGQTFDVVKAMMDQETWLGADEAVALGFATAKAEPAGKNAALNMARGFKALAQFAHVPENLKAVADETADIECVCDCVACKGGDCANCSMTVCRDAYCEDCPIQKAAKTDEANNTLVISEQLFRDLSIPAMFARMSAQQKDGCEVQLSTGPILALRRFGSASLNLASTGEGTAQVARVTGILAPYDSASSDLGGFQEVYQAGCFNKFLAQDDPRVLFNHNIDHVLGRKSAGTARFWEEPDGLHYDADLPDTQAARDLQVSMARGDIKESSAAFYITDYAWENRSGVRTRVIKEARLVEGSPHSFAAYAESTAKPAEVPQAIVNHELELIGARLRLLRVA
jgi:HK97 family phage prohead protease